MLVNKQQCLPPVPFGKHAQRVLHLRADDRVQRLAQAGGWRDVARPVLGLANSLRPEAARHVRGWAGRYMLLNLPFSDGGARPTNGCMTSLHGLQHLLLAQEAAKPLNHQHGIRGACDDQV